MCTRTALTRLVPLAVVSSISCETLVAPEYAQSNSDALLADSVAADDQGANADVSADLGEREASELSDAETCVPSAVCPSVGARCVGADLVECVEDDTGCVRAAITSCDMEGQECRSTEAGAECAAVNPCDGLDLCEAAGLSCDENIAVTCELNLEGCLIRTKQDCSDTDETCVEGQCVSDVCAEVTSACTKPGFSCDGALLTQCGEDEAGCLVLTVIEDCAQVSGGFCSETPPARCNGQTVGAYFFRRLVDTGSELNGVDDVVNDVDLLPVLTTGRAFFRLSGGQTTGASTAILRYVLPTDELQVLVTEATLIPEGFGTFHDFDPLTLPSLTADADILVFAGNGPSAQRGIYQRDSSGLQRRVDRTSLLPGSLSTFVGLSRPQLSGAEVVFNGNDFGSNGGAYLSTGFDGDLSPLAVKGGAMPGGNAGFTGISATAFQDGTSVYEGFGGASPGVGFSGPNRGIYRKVANGQPLEVIADRNLPIVQYDGGSLFEVLSGGHVLGNGIVFYGAGAASSQQPLGFPQHKGLYQWDPSAGYSVIVDTATLVPDASGETFSEEAAGSLDAAHFSVVGETVYFRGVGSIDSFISRIGLYQWHDGDISVVVDDTMTLDGKPVADLYIGRSSASEDGLIFQARFDDGSRGVYIASPIVPTP